MGRHKIRTGLPDNECKLCKKCGRETAITDFLINSKGTIYKACSRCVNTCKVYRNNHKKEMSDYHKNLYKNNKEKINLKNENWKTKNKIRYSLSSRDYNLKKTYGISQLDFEKMLKKQNNVCAICNKPEKINRRTATNRKDLSVDHCHTTTKIRGLLCHSCNLGIGYFQDNIELMKNAIEYVSNGGIHEKKKI